MVLTQTCTGLFSKLHTQKGALFSWACLVDYSYPDHSSNWAS
jgi:hypothetical protein